MVEAYINQHSSQIQTVVQEAAKSAPPVAVTGMILLNTDLDWWIKAGTLLYIALQIGWMVVKFRRDAQRRKEDREGFADTE
jgi:hypothetical protein